MLFVEFMMTSIEIGSVNNCPAQCLVGTVLVRQEMMGRYPSFLVLSLAFPVLGTDESLLRERRELSGSLKTLVNRKIMPDKEWAGLSLDKMRTTRQRRTAGDFKMLYVCCLALVIQRCSGQVDAWDFGEGELKPFESWYWGQRNKQQKRQGQNTGVLRSAQNDNIFS
jgi:hypothetical protein